jgi:hypothetical protein
MSVKQTSTALQAMGLDVAQNQADGLLLDMEERMLDMQSLQKTLATPLTEDYEVDFGTLEDGDHPRARTSVADLVTSSN